MKKGTIIIDPEILADTCLTWLEKIMLARIAGFCNSTDDGTCRLSAAELAEPMALPTYRAQRVISSLRSKGYISRLWMEQNSSVITLGGGDQKGSTPPPKRSHPTKKVTPHQKGNTPSTKKVTPPPPKRSHPLHQKGNTPFYIRTKENEIYNESITNTNACERVITETEMMFSEFWELYPKKRDKRGTEKAFGNIPHLADEFPKILEDIKNKKASAQWTEQGGRFIPNPTTYIHQERWKEEIEPVSSSGMSPTQAEIERLRRKYGGVT